MIANSVIIRAVIFNILWCSTAYSCDNIRLSYGVDVLKRLSDRYPQHFSMQAMDGRVVKVSETDDLGKYLVSIFSEKTQSGWINWAGRHPVAGSDLVFGQCVFYEMLDLNPPRDGIEILLSRNLEDSDSDSETFWAALIFELCNALQAKEFIKVMRMRSSGEIDSDLYSEKMMRIEYASALNARRFQREIWQPFATKNKIKTRPKMWFFADNVSFDQWVFSLSESKRGRQYLETYK